ncbi:MAG: hypothetical protein AAFX85_02470 [Pseudomonadota bacterium]
MKAITLLFITLLSLTVGTAAHAACAQSGNTIGLTGVDNNNGTIYTRVTGGPQACGCTQVRFTPGNSDTKAILSVLLTARALNRTVRVDIQNSSNCDTGYRAYLE